MFRKLLVVAVLVVLVVSMSGCFTSIPSGQVGVYTKWGKAVSVRQPGPNWYNPIGGDIHCISTQVRTYTVANAEASSKDLQTVHSTVATNYRIDPLKIMDFYNNIGFLVTDERAQKVYAFEQSLIEPRAQEVLKSVSARYTANNLIASRETVKHEIEKLLIERLAQYGLVVDTGGVNITNFSFSELYNSAIERKVEAQQDLQTAQVKLETAKVDAETERVRANSYARWDPKLLFLHKWNGALPYYMGGNQMPFPMPKGN